MKIDEVNRYLRREQIDKESPPCPTVSQALGMSLAPPFRFRRHPGRRENIVVSGTSCRTEITGVFVQNATGAAKGEGTHHY